jgi:tRNA pseudouridine38-40 synthase
MPRFKLIIEYDGTPFVGWQVQTNGPSVQGELARAIEGFCGERVIPAGAGRTDAGVHARGQVAHIDLAREHPPETVRDALNFHLRPAPVAILHCELMSDTFDARFSAKARHYLYRIVNRRAPLALDRDRAWQVGHALSEEQMRAGASQLLGRHDFTTFRSAQCQAKSPLRTLDQLDVEREGDAILIHASARSFLHHQVRSMVGSLKLVGEGKWQPVDLRQALEARDRTACGPVAPPCGLYFMHVDY